MPFDSLCDIKQRPVGEVVAGLKADSESASKEAGIRLVRDAAKFGLSVRDYLTLSVKSEGDMSGYELSLAELNLPVKNDFKHGVVLQAASDTFQTYPGTRAMFPEVIDDMLRWASRQEQFEKVAPMLASSRTINGIEMVSTVVDADDEERKATFTVPELGRIPVRTIRTSETSVKIWKHGSALRTSYEFNRRASLDILTPYANRIARELERSKVTAAVNVLINGDGVHAAAPVVNQSSYNSATGATATNGTINWQNFLYWLVQRALAGTPVDTIVGNWDSAFKYAQMWTLNGATGVSDAQNFQRVLGQMNVGGLNIPMPTFAVASAVPANRLLGLTKGETLEELIEAGSVISESERSILNQSMTYVKTENTGYRLVYSDSRSLFNYGA